MKLAIAAALVALAVVAPAAGHVDRVDIQHQDDVTCTTNEPSESGCVFWYGHPHRDVVDGSNAEDYLFSRGGADRLVGHARPDWLDGGRGDDRLSGGSGHDHMYGRQGDDRIDCGEGGGRDDDMANGNGGADVFVDCEMVLDLEPRDRLIRSCDWNDEACHARQVGD